MLARAADEPDFTVLATTPCALSIQVTPSHGGECLWLARCQKFTVPAAIKSAAALSSNHVRPVIIEPFILKARVDHSFFTSQVTSAHTATLYFKATDVPAFVKSEAFPSPARHHLCAPFSEAPSQPLRSDPHAGRVWVSNFSYLSEI